MTWLYVLLGAVGLLALTAGALVLRKRLTIARNRRAWPDYRVEEHPGFLSDEECEHLMAAARPRLQASLSGGADGQAQSSYLRQSENTSLSERDDAVVRQIRDRIAALIGRPRERLEALQVVRYPAFGYYVPHFDASSSRYTERLRQVAGHRDLTVLLYLTDVPAGGRTVFPRLGLSVAPAKGKAIVFENLLPDGSAIHPMSLHAGETVLKGEKWVANQWVRQRAITAEALEAPQEQA